MPDTDVQNPEDVSLPTVDELRDKRRFIAAQADNLMAAVTESQEVRKLNIEGKEISVTHLMSGEELQVHQRLAAEYKALTEQIGMREAVDAADDAEDNRREFIDNAADVTKIKQAKLDVEFHKNLMKAGANQFEAEKVPEQGGAGDIELPVPVIAQNPQTGLNELLPIEARFGQTEADIEASYRTAEIVQAGKQHLYDSKGNLLENLDFAASSDPIRLEDVSLPTMVLRLYAYLINMNMLFRYCDIIQTPGLGPYIRDRRTDIPVAVRIAENTDYGDSQSAFSAMSVNAFKYGIISQVTLESMMSITSFNAASRVVADLGMALSNAFGQEATTGTGSGVAADTQPQGIVTGSQEGATLAAATAFTGASTFNYAQVIKFLTSLDDAYWRAPGKRLMYNLDFVQYLFGLLDRDGRPYFPYENANSEVLGVPVIIDPAIAKFSTTATTRPLIYGDLNAQTVRFAGSPRISFSDEYGWKKDLLSWKATLFAGSATTAPVAIKHHAFTV